MRLRLENWHAETFVCSLAGHVVPAGEVRALRAADGGLGVDLVDGRRLGRCVRCDMWMPVSVPGQDAPAQLDDLAVLPIPRRGKHLREAIVLRCIAVERVSHVLLYALAAAGLFVVSLKLPGLQHGARHVVAAAKATGQAHGNAAIGLLQWLIRVNRGTVHDLSALAATMALLEGVEAVGLWRERRWAEYLTAVATAAWLPIEIHELAAKVTVIRAGALALNILILAWLLYKKRLFGLRGGTKAAERAHEDALDRERLFAAPRQAA